MHGRNGRFEQLRAHLGAQILRNLRAGLVDGPLERLTRAGGIHPPFAAIGFALSLRLSTSRVAVGRAIPSRSATWLLRQPGVASTTRSTKPCGGVNPKPAYTAPHSRSTSRDKADELK
jgi:hypothetical protein